jgi:hypothetical protein
VFFDFLAISLLGLEPTCYEQASNSEKASIKLVLFSFSIILIFSLIATFIIGLFVSGNNWMAFLIAILGTYILISILRFSLILIKPEIKIFTQINEVVIKTTWKEKITGKNKYVFTSLDSFFKSASDESKFDLARKLILTTSENLFNDFPGLEPRRKKESEMFK